MVETDKAPAFGDAIRFQLLIDAVVDYAIFQLDESGRIATWNTGAQRIKGYTESEIIGKHLSTFYTEEDQKSGVPQRALETAGQTGKYEAEGWRVRKDGTKFWALVVIDAIRDKETGKLIGFAKVTRDITERREGRSGATRRFAKDGGCWSIERRHRARF
jgi:PAS domain S-box-containing protein